MGGWGPCARAEYRRLTHRGQAERAEMPSLFLLPARGEDDLHILRLLIDGLIPAEPGLQHEGGHRLNQLMDLSIQPVGDLNINEVVMAAD